MLDVTTVSSDAQLTTTAAVKALLGMTATSDDSLIDSLISRASAWAEAVVGYPLVAQKYRETVAGYGGRRLMLARTPVRAVVGFWDATDTGTATTMLSSDYRLDPGPGFVDRALGWAWDAPSRSRDFSVPLAVDPWPGEEASPWLADYVAGYTRDGIDTGSSLWSTAKGTTSTGRTLPHDIEAAVLEKTVSWYEGSETVLEKQVGDLRIRYGSFGSPMEPLAKDRAQMLLEPYRRTA